MRGIAQLLIVLHFLWAVWMVSGVVIAVAGYRFPRLWRLRVFRWAHLAGIVITATVPLWNRGICPLTVWEGRLRRTPASTEESFLIRLLYEVLYLDVSPIVLSTVSAAGAVLTIWVFIVHPPGRAPSG